MGTASTQTRISPGYAASVSVNDSVVWGAAMSSPRVTYSARRDATPQDELSALVAVNRFILSKSNASQKAGEPAPKLDGHDDAKEAWFPPSGGVLRGG
jgi:hypothetical protein